MHGLKIRANYCVEKYYVYIYANGHVFNVVNENGMIKFLDGQKAVKRTTDTQKADLIYDIYEFLPTNF